MTLLYILSGKNGITSFTYKELELLEERGIQFILLFTKYKKINLVPKKHWRFIILKQPFFFLFIIRKLFFSIFNGIFYESICQKELHYFFVALFFRNKVKIEMPYNVHVQMGDHKLAIGYYLHKFSSGNKLSTTIHAHELYSTFRYKKLNRYQFLLNECSKVFTISEYNKEILVNDLGIASSKVEKMYLYPSFQKEGIKEKKKILMTGNWEFKKGYMDVLDAIVKIPRNDFIVLIAGRAVNPEVDLNLPEIITIKGLDQKVKLLGHLNKTLLEFMYTYCDIFLLPSKTEFYPDGNPKEREGIPVAIMEAISFSLPVISTRHAGIPELVTKYLVEEGNILQIKEAIENCLDDLDKALRDTAINKRNLEHKFTFDNINKLVNYFNQKC